MSKLAARMREQRTITVDLGNGLKLSVIPPSEFEIMLASSEGKPIVELSDVSRYVVGWSGFTEATFLGKSQGSNDPIDFDKEALSEYFKVSTENLFLVVDAINNHLLSTAEKRTAAKKA